VGAVPGIEVGTWAALALQVLGFEATVVLLGLGYGLPGRALVAGTVVVAVASAGSVAMVEIAAAARSEGAPGSRYRRLLLGSRVELVLGLLAFLGLITYLFVVDPRSEPVLLASLLGPEPPAPAVYLLLLLLWDVSYRIGAAWWASVTACWRTVGTPPAARGSPARWRSDRATLAFGVLQLGLLPLVAAHPLLLMAIGGHVAAVVVVSGCAVLLEWRDEN
jgi:hypothetical protein